MRFAVIARHQRHTGRFHQGFGGGLAAHGINGRGGRPEKNQPGGFNRTGKARVLGQEAIPRMYRLRAAGLGGGNDLVDFQVAVGGLAATQIHADISFATMPRIAVSAAVHGDCGEAQRLGGAHDPAGDFTAVGDQ